MVCRATPKTLGRSRPSGRSGRPWTPTRGRGTRLVPPNLRSHPRGSTRPPRCLPGPGPIARWGTTQTPRSPRVECKHPDGPAEGIPNGPADGPRDREAHPPDHWGYPPLDHPDAYIPPVENAAFVWCPNGQSDPDLADNAAVEYYPGDDFVDWVGQDVYHAPWWA